VRLGSSVRSRRQLTSSSNSKTNKIKSHTTSARRGVVAVQAQAAAAEGVKKVVFIGGTGRVGSSAAAALAASDPSVATIVLAGRSEDNYRAAKDRHPSLSGAQFAAIDSADPASLAKAMADAHLVVHSAGPFQGGGDDCAVLKVGLSHHSRGVSRDWYWNIPRCHRLLTHNNASGKCCQPYLKAAIAAKVPYLDLCDDVEYAKRARAMSEEAKAAGVACITSAGIYPGVSNVMAAEMIAVNRAASAASAAAANSSSDDGDEVNDEGNVSGAATAVATAAATAADEVAVEYVLYNYFCAGSGGVGTTILATSYMLCGEEVVCWDGDKAGAVQVE
jgi:hypothetical protein